MVRSWRSIPREVVNKISQRLGLVEGTVNKILSRLGLVEGTIEDISNTYQTKTYTAGVERELTQWTLSNGTEDEIIYSMLHANGAFIAVGVKVIYRSEDGISWSKVFTTDVTLRCVTYNKDIFIAVGYNGVIYRSEDGISWEDVSPNIDVKLYSVTHNNDLFVAVGEGSLEDGTDLNSSIIYSNDGGLNWYKAHYNTPNAKLWSIVHGKDKFVTVGVYGISAYSEDGITWTSGNFSNDGSGTPNVVVYGNGKYVLCGSNGISYYSEDGITWTQGTGTGTGATSSVYECIYDNDLFIAVGTNSFLYTSKDGVTWDRICAISNSIGCPGNAIAISFNDNKYVVAGTFPNPCYSKREVIKNNIEDVINTHDKDIKNILDTLKVLAEKMDLV